MIGERQTEQAETAFGRTNGFDQSSILSFSLSNNLNSRERLESSESPRCNTVDH